MAIVGYWRFNGNSNDASGNANNGSDTNITYSQANGIIDGGAGFNGSTSSITVNDSDSTSLSGNFTFSLWVNPAALPANNGEYRNFFSKWDMVGTTMEGYEFRFLKNSNKQYINTAIGNASNYAEIAYEYTTALNAWIHLISTYDGSKFRIFVNGIFKAEANNSVNPRAGAKNLCIGNFGYYTGTSSVLSRYLSGKMENLIIDNAAWSYAAIKNEYSRVKGFF